MHRTKTSGSSLPGRGLLIPALPAVLPLLQTGPVIFCGGWLRQGNGLPGCPRHRS
jgi:hypothetical protein